MEKQLKNKELFNKYKISKDINIRNQIVDNNFNIVETVANRFSSNFNIEYDEVLSIATIGLIKAIDKYSYNIPFNLYAINYISSFVRNEFTKLFGLGSKHFFQIYDLGNELFENFDMNNKEMVYKTLEVLNKNNSVSENMNNLNNTINIRMSSSLNELKEVLSYDDLEDLFVQDNINDELMSAIDRLNDYERFIIMHSFGINNCEKKSLREIAKLLNTSHQRVFNNINKTIEKIKRYLLNRNISEDSIYYYEDNYKMKKN